MATLFTLLKKQTSGMATVFARVQCSHPKVNVRVSTGIEVDAAKWNLKRDGVAFRNFQSSPEGEKLFNYLGKIEKAIAAPGSEFTYEKSIVRIREWQDLIRPYLANATGEDQAIQDLPASWSNNRWYRIMEDGSNNWFRIKCSVLSAL